MIKVHLHTIWYILIQLCLKGQFEIILSCFWNKILLLYLKPHGREKKIKEIYIKVKLKSTWFRFIFWRHNVVKVEAMYELVLRVSWGVANVVLIL